jgi:hypothetical protein
MDLSKYPRLVLDEYAVSWLIITGIGAELHKILQCEKGKVFVSEGFHLLCHRIHIIKANGDFTAGFRYTNDWLANLTNHAFSRSFYIGDTLGSFNSWMRIFTGLLFGLTCAAFIFPYVDQVIVNE